MSENLSAVDSQESCSAIILNGGSARRMSGADKAYLTVSGKPIVEHQLYVLRQRFDEIAMVNGTRETTNAASLPLLGDRVGGLGPLDGIASGLAWCPSDWLFVVASDMPFVSLVAIDTLLQARTSERDIVAARIGSREQPLLALYRRKVLAALDIKLGNRELRASKFLRSPPESVRVGWLSESDFDEDSLRAFDNLNTPQDLKNLVPMAQEIE